MGARGEGLKSCEWVVQINEGMSMADKRRCDKCEFYEEPPRSDEKVVRWRSVQAEYEISPGPTVHRRKLGSCRGGPPYFTSAYGHWPEVKADDWCGMFKEREPMSV